VMASSPPEVTSTLAFSVGCNAPPRGGVCRPAARNVSDRVLRAVSRRARGIGRESIVAEPESVLLDMHPNCKNKPGGGVL
jgi:hypothetical protein